MKNIFFASALMLLVSTVHGAETSRNSALAPLSENDYRSNRRQFEGMQHSVPIGNRAESFSNINLPDLGFPTISDLENYIAKIQSNLTELNKSLEPKISQNDAIGRFMRRKHITEWNVNNDRVQLYQSLLAAKKTAKNF
jgi:hypothetical protein